MVRLLSADMQWIRLEAFAKTGFRESIAKSKTQRRKWVKLLSKHILDCGLAKGECTVEFREVS
jgi:hypothetical protein